MVPDRGAKRVIALTKQKTMKKTAKYYKENPEAYKKKLAYDKKNNAEPKNVKKRVELNAYNRKAQKEGRAHKGDGKDASHKGGKIVGFESASRNRGSKSNSAGDRRARGKGSRKG